MAERTKVTSTNPERWGLLAAGLMALGFLLPGCGSGQGPATVVFSGTLQWPDGKPVAKARVALYKTSDNETTWETWGGRTPAAETNQEGRFEIALDRARFPGDKLTITALVNCKENELMAVDIQPKTKTVSLGKVILDPEGFPASGC